MNSSAAFCIDAEAFDVEEREDNETNPGVYGRAFSAWLAARFEEAGQPVESVVPEDWGWCVILQRKPFLLWVGCGNEHGSKQKWKAFVVAEGGIWMKVFRRVDIADRVADVSDMLEKILANAPGVIRTWTE